jgi:ketosteroid isomerase-like protein
MHPNEQLLTRLYSAFAARDAATMVSCYAPDATFDDPVFSLRGAEVSAMWQMFCSNAKSFSLTFSGIRADDSTGVAHWEPCYHFATTGRPVINRIDSRFAFRDGLIVAQQDSFDFWRWSRQALGLPGWALGWSGWLRGRVRAKARRQLDRFIARSANR